MEGIKSICQGWGKAGRQFRRKRGMKRKNEEVKAIWVTFSSSTPPRKERTEFGFQILFRRGCTETPVGRG
jgi:hypothetical protein